MERTLIRLAGAVLLGSGLAAPAGHALEPAGLSPAAYCRAAGGALRATGTPDLVVCCYDATRACVASDLRQRYSRRVPFDENERRVLLARELEPAAD